MGKALGARFLDAERFIVRNLFPPICRIGRRVDWCGVPLYAIHHRGHFDVEPGRRGYQLVRQRQLERQWLARRKRHCFHGHGRFRKRHYEHGRPVLHDRRVDVFQHGPAESSIPSAATTLTTTGSFVFGNTASNQNNSAVISGLGAFCRQQLGSQLPGWHVQRRQQQRVVLAQHERTEHVCIQREQSPGRRIWEQYGRASRQQRHVVASPQTALSRRILFTSASATAPMARLPSTLFTWARERIRSRPMPSISRSLSQAGTCNSIQALVLPRP